MYNELQVSFILKYAITRGFKQSRNQLIIDFFFSSMVKHYTPKFF